MIDSVSGVSSRAPHKEARFIPQQTTEFTVAKRTRAQKDGDEGERLVLDLIDRHPAWTGRKQEQDFGIDLEAEYGQLMGSAQQLTGCLVKLQVKAGVELTHDEIGISVRLKRSYLGYISQFRVPVILVAVDLTERKAWFIWLQKWLFENVLAAGADSAVVTIPTEQTLEAGLDGPLQAIATGRDDIALWLAYRELLLASATTGNFYIFDILSTELATNDELRRGLLLEHITDAIIGLGEHGGYWRTAQLVPLIHRYIDRLGIEITGNQLLRLVIRNDSYSRAGFEAVVRLYDRHHEHARQLDLPNLSREAGNEHIAWYCEFREHHPYLNSLDLYHAAVRKKLRSVRFGELTLPNSDETVSHLSRHWPNRGDSIYLECLVLAGPEVTRSSC